MRRECNPIGWKIFKNLFEGDGQQNPIWPLVGYPTENIIVLEAIWCSERCWWERFVGVPGICLLHSLWQLQIKIFRKRSTFSYFRIGLLPAYNLCMQIVSLFSK